MTTRRPAPDGIPVDGPPADAAPSRAEAVFVGATRYTGPLAWLRLAPQWFAMVKEMRRMRGYLHHRVYYEPPFTLGTLGFFQTRDDLMRFARSGTHRHLMGWVLDEDNATGGYIRVYERVHAMEAVEAVDAVDGEHPR